ncbi:NAD-dependent epimerase/dehydratase family protein [Anaeromyxobacter paludicola]|uniref:GDP-mannose 4,6-dehydratase n=1 Tax=Anaeromyxobacter paludicola TaxID=2918171 RepID=A0ABN6N4W1_9BACT|nr:NAD-dependent epimerase/dehydratase family protein [Anaeromyxobacter paludicola]BDG07083.1 GDP-mannose 4,6-dehydratase [Anaeromyxobacter paludicola]
MPETVLLTGATGYLGAALRSRAVVEGARCLAVGRRPRAEEGYRQLDLAAGPEAVAALLRAERPQVIFHLAGGAAGDPFALNLPPLRNLLAALRSIPGYLPRLVTAGSAAEYGDLGPDPIDEGARERPVTEYGVAKLAQARLVALARRGGLPTVVGRVFNAIGPGMPPTLASARFAREVRAAIASGARHVTVGDLSTVRDYLDVEDVAAALWALGHGALSDPIVNVCSGEGVRTGEVLAEIQRQLGVSLEVRTDPGLVRGPFDVPVSVGRNDRLRAALGEAPRFSLPRAVARLLDGG